MSLSQIITISGKPGLFKILAQSPGRVIVQSLEDGKKMPVFMRHNFSVLQDICLYTDEEELPLEDAFSKIYDHEKGKESISHKASNADLAERLEAIIPTYDKDEVSFGDMKKLFKWYNTLVTKGDWQPESDEKDKKKKKKGKNADEEE